MNKLDYIAVFDSGLGGLSVLRELQKLMPGERFLYFGDRKNAPYGVKSTEEVRRLTLSAAQRLMEKGCKALVVACNTATAAAIGQLRTTYPEKVIVGIEPALKPAAEQFPAGPIGIMATEVTLREEKLSVLMLHYPNTELIRIPAPGLVEHIEAGKPVDGLLKKLLCPYKNKLKALVLGCTHYPLVKEEIQKVLPATVLFDGSAGTARQTRRLLEEKNLLSPGPGCVEYLEEV